MVEIQQLRFAVKLPELLRFRLVLPEVTIEKPIIVLEKNAEGQVNWQIGRKRDAAPDDRTAFPVIGRLAINDGQLIYRDVPAKRFRSEEHTSELQSLMRLSYAVFCLNKTNHKRPSPKTITVKTPAQLHTHNRYTH